MTDDNLYPRDPALDPPNATSARWGAAVGIKTDEILIQGDDDDPTGGDPDVMRLDDVDLLSDDHSEIDEATEILQDHTEDGLSWGWIDGNLLLVVNGVLD